MSARFLTLAAVLLGCTLARADSTIDPANAFAWAANLGELNWRPSLADGAVTGEYVCSGKIWSANTGWINLGSGTPANEIRYQNLDGADFGVNLLADGSLRGLAWAANVGWINFEATGNPRLDFATGALRGYAWGANIGWVTLEASGAHSLVTLAIPASPDTDGDGIADAWEREHAGNLTALSRNGDADRDGISDLLEYAADSNPFNGADAGIRLADFTLTTDRSTAGFTWTSHLSRRYHLEYKDSLLAASWTESSLGEIAPDATATTHRILFQSSPPSQRFYRIRATRPLAP